VAAIKSNFTPSQLARATNFKVNFFLVDDVIKDLQVCKKNSDM